MGEQATPATDAFWADARDEVALRRYQALVDTVGDGLYQLDPEGRFVAVNQVIADVTGYSREELLGEHVSIILPDEEIDCVESLLRERLRNRSTAPETLELSARTASGEPIHFELRLTPLIEDGEFRGTIGVARESSARKWAEKALAERERHLRRERDLVERTLGTSPVGIAVLDGDGKVLRVNERGTELLGVDDGTETTDRTLYDEDGRERSIGDGSFVPATDFASSADENLFEVVTDDGESTWLSINVVPLADGDEAGDRIVAICEDVTDLKEREYHRSQRTSKLSTELEEIFGRVTDAFCALDEQWRFTYANERAEELLDATDEGLVGKHVREAFDWAADSRLREVFERAMDAQVPASFESYYAEPIDAWFEINAYPSETGLSVYFRDITERTERERYLEDAKAQLEAATEAGAIGTWEWHVQEDEFVAGASMAKQFGVDPDEARKGVPRERFISSVHEDDYDRVVAAVDRAREACGEYEAEYRVRNAAGEIRWVVARGHFECDEDGTPRTFPGAFVDITERKRAEEALYTHKQQLETLFDVLPVGVMVANTDGQLVEVNDVAREIWGDSGFETGAAPTDSRWVGTGDPIDPEEWTLARVLDGETVTDPDVVELDAGETTRTVMVHGMPIRDYDGRIRRGVITLTDITERKEYQRMLEETITQLEASNDRLEQFAYAASHDLQEPLRMISTYLTFIEQQYDDVLDERGMEFLAFAVDGAERMREMIDGLLQYARVETRGDPLRSTDLDETLEAALENLQMKAAETDAEITAEALPRVRGDASQLRQVFQNLLENALEYCGDEPPVIHVSAERAGDWCRISVRDEGIGIEPSNQDRIFEVFQRLHTREEHSGTGIGLSLCQRIVERHDGEIRVESKPGAGTTFTFTLPAGPEPDE